MRQYGVPRISVVGVNYNVHKTYKHLYTDRQTDRQTVRQWPI